MWKSLVLTCLLIPWTTAQNERNHRPFNNGYGWDIRLSVPGEPGNDYPTLNSIPRTSFTCSGKEPGYYADVETNCQVFRVCTLGSTYGFQSFLCPNGTLFNQAVFVCDWWMKVNCKKSQGLFKFNNNKYGSLKLGTQFMTDIKKMITHPMRNPYDDIYTKNNLIVMQEYKPPMNQLYNGALSIGSKSPTYAQTKYSQKNTFQDIYSNDDISYPTSTPSTQYFSKFNTHETTANKNNEFIQKHKQSKPYVLPNRTTNLRDINTGFVLNGHGGQTSQANDIDIISYSKNTHSVRPTQVYQRSIQSTQAVKVQENNSRIGKSKQNEFGTDSARQHLNLNVNRDKLLSSVKNSQLHYSKDVVGVTGNKTKQNLVSSDTPSAIITKTLAFRRIIKDTANGTPKSRITFKTWIVRPSKNSKLIVEPTPYTYRPANIFQKIIADIPGDGNLNKSIPNIESEEVPYVYNPPNIQLNEQIITTSKETANLRLSSTISPETMTSSPAPAISSTEPSPLYLAPTTFKPSSLLYLPPNTFEQQISRQYLSPIIENSKLVAAPSSPRPFVAISRDGPSFVLRKQTHVNTNHNNITFSDILTKEKLDITVNNIVKDTNNALENVSSNEIEHFKEDIQSIDYPIDNYLYSNSDTQSDEKVTLQSPPPLPRSSKLIESPSIDLLPPIEPSSGINPNKNRISNLPYYEESTGRPNTIERTVSLKVTIPENIADLLFKRRNTSNSEHLEILNTSNNNNWVLANNIISGTGASIVPIGKLIWDKNSNVSNSQDLVFSLLIDSINAAKDYNNIAQQNIISSTQPTHPQFPNVKSEELQRITNDISHLTSSQFSALNSSSNYRRTNLKTMSPSMFKSLNKNKNSKLINGYPQNQKVQIEQQNLLPYEQSAQEQIQPTTIPLSGNDDFLTVPINSDQIYSGQLYQLPVPIVTKQIYNSPYPPNYKLSNNEKTQSQTDINTNSNSMRDTKQSKSEIEIIQSHAVDANTFQLAPSTETIKDQGSSANAFIDSLKLPKNGITAHVQDSIVGTLPHPLDEDKLIKYKKGQTYYIYTHLNNDDETNSENQINSIQNTIANNLAIRQLYQGDKSDSSAFQLIPSLGYKLEDGNEKHKYLNALRINEYSIPRPVLANKKANLARLQDTVATEVDFKVEHPKSKNKEKPGILNTLYDGPNSYSAPQRSVGNLVAQDYIQRFSNVNSRIEKFDTEDDKNVGYPKISPVKRFLF